MRKLDDWIDGFHALCAPRKVPNLFAEWAGLACMSAFVQRRYWFLSDRKPSYPTLYILLIGEPAVGKGIAIEPCEDILRQLDNINISTDSLTVAALGDEFNSSDNAVYHVGAEETIEANVLTVISKELQAFLPQYDSNMLARLINVWDFKGYSERTRGKGEKIFVPNAHLTLIAGTTPNFMSNLLPDQAWEGGFMSRCIPVYWGVAAKRMFSEEGPEENAQLFGNLVDDAKTIMSGLGRFRFTDDAYKAIHKWHIENDGEPKQNHPKMRFYNDRRLWNSLRMALLYSISRGGTVIDACDFQRALNLLVNTETQMVELFKALKTGGDEEVMRECHHYISIEYAKAGGPVKRAKVMRFLTSRVQSFRAEGLLDAMVQAGILELREVHKIGPCLVPVNPEFDS